MSDVMSRDDKGRHYGMQNDRKNRGKMGGFVTQHGFQASTMVCRHSIHLRYISGQMGMAELNEKASISRSKTKMSEQSRVDRNNRIKIEKGVILLQ
jgi:hypothetical protein